MRMSKKMKMLAKKIVLAFAIAVLVFLISDYFKPTDYLVAEPGPSDTPTPIPAEILPAPTNTPEGEEAEPMRFGKVIGDSHFRDAPNFRNDSIVTTIAEGTIVQLIQLRGPFWIVVWDELPGYVGKVMIEELP